MSSAMANRARVLLGGLLLVAGWWSLSALPLFAQEPASDSAHEEMHQMMEAMMDQCAAMMGGSSMSLMMDGRPGSGMMSAMMGGRDTRLAGGSIPMMPQLVR